MSNCIFEATLQQIEVECNCTPKNFIDIVKDFEACTGEGKRCMNRFLQVQVAHPIHKQSI